MLFSVCLLDYVSTFFHSSFRVHTLLLLRLVLPAFEPPLLDASAFLLPADALAEPDDPAGAFLPFLGGAAAAAGAAHASAGILSRMSITTSLLAEGSVPATFRMRSTPMDRARCCGVGTREREREKEGSGGEK